MKRILRALIPLSIVAGGAVVAGVLVSTGPKAAPKETEAPITFVEAVTVAPTSHRPRIEAMGVVAAQKQVAMMPEVAGRVVEQNRALVPGGRIAAGDPLIRIDARDYSAAVAASKADLAQAKVALREEKTLRQVAQHEWRQRPEGFSDETLKFALREPHLDAANARLSSAKSRIAKAKRDLGRTILRAPFDAVVIDESVDVGQTVSPGAPVATLAGIGRYWVRVSLPVSQLAKLKIPEVNSPEDKGSPAIIYNEAAGPGHTREGYVLRLHGTVDQRGRMAQLYVAVDDPLSVLQPVGKRPLPLLLGTNVRVEISGRPLEHVVVLPRQAVMRDGSVWVLDGDDRLTRREVDVVWRERGKAVIADGLSAAERVVTTRLPTATEGMKVTLAQPED